MTRRRDVRPGLAGELRFEDDLGSYLIIRRAVDLGSLVAAARSLGLGKMGTRQKLARLEARLGLRLLERTTRRLTPTAAGLAYLERYGRLHAEVMAARSQLTGRPAPPAAVEVLAAAAPEAAPGEEERAEGLPARIDLVLRRLAEGEWAAVCFPRELISTGRGPREVLRKIAEALVAGTR